MDNTLNELEIEIKKLKDSIRRLKNKYNSCLDEKASATEQLNSLEGIASSTDSKDKLKYLDAKMSLSVINMDITNTRILLENKEEELEKLITKLVSLQNQPQPE